MLPLNNFVSLSGSQLRVISTMSAGLDNVDIQEIKARGIKLGHTPKVLNDAVAEMAVLLTLATLRRLTEGRKAIEKYVSVSKKYQPYVIILFILVANGNSEYNGC